MKKQNLFSVLALAILVAGSMARAEGTAAPAAPAAKPAGPSDAVIAHIAVTANVVDAEAGEVGKMSTDKDVKEFAKKMIAGHTSIKNSALALATKLHVTAEDNDTSKALKKGGDENCAHLKTLKGHQFDLEYIKHEVEYHKTVVNALKNLLVPNAKNPELKTLLEGATKTIEGHLEHAEKVLAKVEGAKK
jgi:putative membrane protein